jgi:ethanolamine utilization protein EutA
VRLSSAYVVTTRKVVHRSPVALTPYAGARRIDTDALSTVIEDAYAGAGWSRDTVDTGAVIATGEAARKENAAAIVDLFSGQAGRFVCATAGHNLEAILAAHGSGAVATSRRRETPVVLNVDIGGGTTKLAVCREGHVDETAALDVGARVISWDAGGTLLSVTAAGERLAASLGLALRPGARPARAALERIADAVADVVLRVPEGRAMDRVLWLTAPVRSRGPFDALVFSGGVGEYVNGNETREFGDLGWLVGAAITRRLRVKPLPAVESIRATCIGASQYTIQVSGDTLFVTRPDVLPLRDLAAIALRPVVLAPAEIAREVRAGIERLDRGDGRFAVAVRWRHGPRYAALHALCAGISEGVRGVLSDDQPLVVVLDADIAGIVGQILHDEMAIGSPIVCVDQIALSDLDFIDVGAIVPDKHVVPVVVKSLVFAER